jgi:hypothetical protein
MSAAVAPPRARTGVALARRGMTRVAHVRRYSEIVGVLVKYGFVDVVHALHLTPYLAASRRVLSALGRASHDDPTGARRLRSRSSDRPSSNSARH